MALYQNATNLQGRGNFAPGVSYYAGIKAPVPAAPDLPKHESVFNIDLSRIGDAMIAAKESETKLGMAAVEMEENLRNAERERQFKLELSDREQAAENARLDKQLAMNWEIAKLNNATELQKAQYKKEQGIKDQSNKALEEALMDSVELNEGWIDYRSGKIDYDAFDRIQAEALRKAVNMTGGSPSHGLEYFNKRGFTAGRNYTFEDRHDEQKKINTEVFNNVKDTARTVYPDLFASDPESAINKATNFNNNVMQVRQWQNVVDSSSDPDEKKWAQDQLNKNIGTIALDMAIRSVRSTMNSIRSTDDPATFIQNMESIAIDQISQVTGKELSEVAPIVREVYRTSGLTDTLGDIVGSTETSANYKKYQLDALSRSDQLDLATNGGPILRSYITLKDIPAFNYLQQEDKMNVAQIASAVLFGTITPNPNRDEGGYIYNYRGQSVTFSAEQLNRLSEQTGINFTNQDQVALYFGGSLVRDGKISKDIKEDKITITDASNALINTANLATGVKDNDYSAAALSVADLAQMDRNLKTNCDAGKVCPIDSILDGIDNLPKDSPQRKEAETLGQFLHARWTLTSKNNEVTMAELDGHTRYVGDPTRISGKDIAAMLGGTYKGNEKYWDAVSLKDTRITYTVEDDKVKLGYWQNGILKTGGTELRKSMDYIENFMDKNSIPVEEQVAYYKKRFPGIIESKQSEEKWLSKASTYIQENTLDTAAKIETGILSFLTGDPADMNAEVLEENRTVKATDDPFNKEKYPLVPNGKDMSSVLNTIIEADGMFYIIPTMWGGEKHTEEEAIQRFKETGFHFGGYSDLNAADKAEQVMHRMHEQSMQARLTPEDITELSKNLPKLGPTLIKNLPKLAPSAQVGVVAKTITELAKKKEPDQEFADYILQCGEELANSAYDASRKFGNVIINEAKVFKNKVVNGVTRAYDATTGFIKSIIKYINDNDLLADTGTLVKELEKRKKAK